MDIHKRKVQQFAKYSYAVTLPIHWVKRNHLEKDKSSDHLQGSEKNPEISDSGNISVNLYEMPDGSLQIYPEKPPEVKKDDIALIDLDDMIKQNPAFIEEKTIQMILISNYMNGMTGVEIMSKKPIPDELVEQVERTQDRLLFNWNTSRINAYKLLIKNVFTETPENIFQDEIPRYLKESFQFLLGMIEDIETALQEQHYQILTTIATRDDKIDRYYFFIVRQIRTIFDNPQIAKPVKYSHKKLVDLRLLSKIIEDVGDLLKVVANNLYSMQKFFEEVEIRPYLLDFFKTLRTAYSRLYDIFVKWIKQSGFTERLSLAIMPDIQQFRLQGKNLFQKWEETASNIQLGKLRFNFMDTYMGSTLIYAIRDIYDKIFDFTNLFY
jgi:phosphate uptake regulator